MSDNYDSRLMH